MISVQRIMKQLFVSPRFEIIILDISIMIFVLYLLLNMGYGILLCYRQCCYLNTRIEDDEEHPPIFHEKSGEEIKCHLHQQLEALEFKLEQGMTDMEYMTEIEELHQIYQAVERGYFSIDE